MPEIEAKIGHEMCQQCCVWLQIIHELSLSNDKLEVNFNAQPLSCTLLIHFGFLRLVGIARLYSPCFQKDALREIFPKEKATDCCSGKIGR